MLNPIKLPTTAPLSPALTSLLPRTPSGVLSGFGSPVGGSLLTPERGAKTQPFMADVVQFEEKLLRTTFYGSSEAAQDTLELMRAIIQKGYFKTIDDLINAVKEAGGRLIHARPLELVVGNVLRRVLFTIRRTLMRRVSEAQKQKQLQEAEAAAAAKMLSSSHSATDTALQSDSGKLDDSVNISISDLTLFDDSQTDHSSAVGGGLQSIDEKRARLSVKIGAVPTEVAASASYWEDDDVLNPSLLDTFRGAGVLDTSVEFKAEYKSELFSELKDLSNEINNVYDEIKSFSVEHIHSDELVLTYDMSRTVLEFLKHAATKRQFDVIIVESAPALRGHRMAKALADRCRTAAGSDGRAGIRSVTVVSDAALFAIMSRVNKVIVGTHGVLANGGLLSDAGTHALALAAKYYRVPFLVVTGMYKLSPLYALDQDSFNKHGATQALVPFDVASVFCAGDVEAVNPTFDYVPPELVDLLITNVGGYSAAYVYRLLAEYYNSADYSL